MLAGLLVSGQLGACGQLPQPFRPSEGSKHHNSFLMAPGSAVVAILPVTGIGHARGQRIATELAQMLQRQGLPALVGPGHAGSYLLSANGFVSADQQTVEIRWFLDGSDSINLLQKNQLWPAEIDPETSDRAALTRQLSQISMAIREKLTAPLSAKERRLRFSVSEVIGAPSDGNKALQRAMALQLQRAGYQPEKDDLEVDYFVLGVVEVTTPRMDVETITVSWSLMHINGEPIGQLAQSNNVPAGTATKSWRQMAAAISAAALPAIEKLVKQFDFQNPSAKRQ